MLLELQQISKDIWRDKYRNQGEETIDDTYIRIADGVSVNDSVGFRTEVLELLRMGCLLPAGRVQAGIGTNKRVTLINCFVCPTIQDSMDTMPDLPGAGIMDALKVSALTQQMGGGIGMGFSGIRPLGAIVKRTGSVSTGVLPFMDMWHAMCGTVKSSGSRRGAMMATLGIWHPDIIAFIHAKKTTGRLTNFNVSVLVPDDFMIAVERDETWELHFGVPRADGNHVRVVPATIEHGERYVYQEIRARELWDLITENTYIYAEPGVIFITRVNTMNNLSYCEDIEATNPCGEQPLPPNGDCDLGHNNLAAMVIDPFGPYAKFDFELLKRTTKCLIRFLDNVIDITLYATKEQEEEAKNKRRTGAGFTGLANVFQMVGIIYGSPESVQLASEITYTMCVAAYEASIELAKERGPFPMYVKEEYIKAPFIKKLPKWIQEGIEQDGLRNGLLLSLAPTGTTSLEANNVSSGLEPVWSLEGKRKILQDDGSFREDVFYDYGALLWRHLHRDEPMPKSMTHTAEMLTVDEHLNIQAAVQEWIDAAVSKTINVPTEMAYEDFKEVYTKAFNLNLKGCTTYRSDERSGRGAVLTRTDEPEKRAQNYPVPMQEVLEGRRYRVKWPRVSSVFYIIINDYTDSEGKRRPFEVFINTKDARFGEWLTALTLLITAIFRRGGDVSFICEELKQVSSLEGAFMDGKYQKSLVAAIAEKIEEHFLWLGLLNQPLQLVEPEIIPVKGERCPGCGAPTVVYMEGCKKCSGCGFSECG